MAKNCLEVHILGSTFTIQSEQDLEYLQKVIDYLNVKINEIRQGFSTHEPLKISLLASLNLVDELFKLKNQDSFDKHDSSEIEQITKQLISKIDNSLLEK